MNEGEAGFVPQESLISKVDLRENTLKVVEEVKTRFPNYSHLLDRAGKLGLYDETANNEGKHAGITLQVAPKMLKYSLGYVEVDGKKLHWKSKNLPRIHQAIGYAASSGKGAGIQLDYPPSYWEFEANDIVGRNRAFENMFKVLNLLRLHEEF